MPLSLQAISRLLPPGLPGSISEEASTVLRRIEGGAENPLGRAFLWSYYVLQSYRDNFSSVIDHFEVELERDEKIPQRINPSVGFFPIDQNIYTRFLSPVALELGFFFGAVLYDRRWLPPDIPPYQLPTTPRIGVVQYPVVFIPHAPLDPTNAATTCWASSADKTEGILTCKHAIAGLSRRSNVAMKDGSTGRLIDFAPGSVDAAFIETQSGIPTNVKPLAIESHPINGSTVTADFRSHYIGNAQILSSWYFADNLDPYNAMRVYIDHWGQPSDSGSLVSSGAGKGVGIYTGEFTGNATQQGICQYLPQAIDQLNLKVFI